MPLHPWITDRIHHLHAMPALGGFSTDEGYAAWRAFSRAEDYSPPDVAMREVHIARRDPRESSLRVRVYSPRANPSSIGLVWCHGGAYAGGSVEMFEADGVARELVARTRGTVISVDYRLVTDTIHYPAPTDDVRLAWEWACESADNLGLDQARLGLGGASAGASLAAAVTLALKDDNAALPSRVVLAYPMVHPLLPAFSHELARKLTDVPDILNYSLGDHRSNDVLEALLGGPLWTATSHAMAGLGDVEGFPTTFIVNSEYDALRASGQQFAAQLALAGVNVCVRNEPGVLHGHLNLPPVFASVSDSLDWIGAALQA